MRRLRFARSSGWRKARGARGCSGRKRGHFELDGASGISRRLRKVGEGVRFEKFSSREIGRKICGALEADGRLNPVVGWLRYLRRFSESEWPAVLIIACGIFLRVYQYISNRSLCLHDALI